MHQISPANLKHEEGGADWTVCATLEWKGDYRCAQGVLGSHELESKFAACFFPLRRVCVLAKLQGLEYAPSVLANVGIALLRRKLLLGVKHVKVPESKLSLIVSDKKRVGRVIKLFVRERRRKQSKYVLLILFRGHEKPPTLSVQLQLQCRRRALQSHHS